MSDPAKDGLILSCLPMVEKIAARMAKRCGHSVDADDLMSEGMIGVMDAAKRFDPARGVKFTTMAQHRATGAMLDSLRKLDWLPKERRRRVKAGMIDAPPRVVNIKAAASRADSAEPPWFRTDQADSVRALMRGLDRRSRMVVLSSVVCGLGPDETAFAVGISPSRACQLRTNALAALKGRLTRTIPHGGSTNGSH